MPKRSSHRCNPLPQAQVSLTKLLLDEESESADNSAAGIRRMLLEVKSYYCCNEGCEKSTERGGNKGREKDGLNP